MAENNLEGLILRRPYKVIQIVIDGVPNLAAGLGRHHQILEKILKEKGMDFSLIPPPLDPKSDLRVPCLSGQRYSVLGMGGLFRVNEQLVWFSGSSHDYGIGICENHLIEYQKLHPGLEYEIRRY